MSPQEWWWEADMRISIHRKMTPAAGGFSEAEWADARKRHREKMGAKNG